MPQELPASPQFTRDLERALGRVVRGQVRFDRLNRQLYSTDASCYRIAPLGVVIPRDADDAAAAIDVLAQHRVSLVPRGAGTSLSGQSVGPGVILDHSAYLNHVLEVDSAGRMVSVEAGVVLDQLNAALRSHELMVGPDPASSAAATLGGMAGNNSTGTHSIQYGMMVDHVSKVEVILADGTRATFSPASTERVEVLARQANLEGSLYRSIPPLLDAYRDEILSRYPKTWRNVAGYNLNRLLADRDAGRPLNLASLIVGSEGTLASITRVTLGLVPRPRRTRLMILHFRSIRAALEIVPYLLENQPAAIELFDPILIRQARANPAFGARVDAFIHGEPEAALMVEFAGNSDGDVAGQAAALEARLGRVGYYGATVHCIAAEEIGNVWAMRKAFFGLLMSVRSEAKPLNFVDDTTVPVESLVPYMQDIDRLCHDLQLQVHFHAHASAGCIHVNPVINLKTEKGLQDMRLASQGIMEIALRYGGTSTGEHGEGLARSIYNERVFGPRLHQAFREVKGLFDPENRMNPGKIVDAPEPWDPAYLRFSPQYSAPLAPPITLLDFSADGGLTGLVEACNGQGVCRKRDEGVMCPSYRATGDEKHSTRGRANALRAAMTGQLGPDGLASRELFDALDLCLECKACKFECPTLVDMAKLKYEFLFHYQSRRGVPLRSRLFAQIGAVNRIASRVSTVANWTLQNPIARLFLDRALGIARERTLPALAPETFQAWFARRTHPQAPLRGTVLLWQDCYLSYNEPEIGRAAVRVLEAAGFGVRTLQDLKCCGRPMISKGLLPSARANAAHNVARLAPLAAQGIPIVGLEPSCIAAFRDEYPDLLRNVEARRVAANSWFIEEFLVRANAIQPLDLRFRALSEPQQVLVHGHCYQKALGGTAPLLEMLRWLPNTTVSEIPSGCCGMAGAFGYEKEHYSLSMAVGEETLFPAVRGASLDTRLGAAGISCRHQIAAGTGRRAVHPIMLLQERLEPERP